MQLWEPVNNESLSQCRLVKGKRVCLHITSKSPCLAKVRHSANGDGRIGTRPIRVKRPFTPYSRSNEVKKLNFKCALFLHGSLNYNTVLFA